MRYVSVMGLYRIIIFAVTLLALASVSANASVEHGDHHPEHAAAEDAAMVAGGADDRAGDGAGAHVTHPCGVCHHMTALPFWTADLCEPVPPLAFVIEHQSVAGFHAAPPHQPPIG